MQYEMVEACKAMLSHPELQKTLITTFVMAFQDPEVQKGVAGLLEECFHKILLDKETIDKFRIFVYNLMAMELEDSRGKKSSLLDLILSKAVARKPGQKEDIRAIIESKSMQPQQQSIADILANVTPVEITSPNAQAGSNQEFSNGSEGKST